MSNDEEILRNFRAALSGEPGVSAPAVSREDLIERAEETFKPLLDFVDALNRTARETVGGEASVAFNFGDFDGDALNAFIIVTPVRADQQNSILNVKFQGVRLFFDHRSLWRENGSRAYDAADIDEAKAKLAIYVASAMKMAV